MINENKKAVKTVSLIIFATAFSKILGLLRDIFMAYFYGGSMENAAFATALRVPLVFFDIVLGAAVLGVFIPVYNSFGFDLKSGREKEKDEFANIFLNFVLIITALLALFGAVFSEQIINFMTPGPDYSDEARRLASNLLKILFPMIIFTGAVYTLTGVLQSKGEFLAPALVSAASNLGIIAYFLFLNKTLGIYGLAAAYLAAWLIQLITLVIPLVRKKYRYKFILKLKNEALIKAAKMSPPIMAGSWLVPAGMLIGLRFLSYSDEPELYIAAFGYSTTVFLLAAGILTYGVCNYIFPKLAQNANNGEEFAKIVKGGLSSSLFVIAPAACVLFALREEAVAVLFNRGEFKETIGLAVSTSRMLAPLAPSMLMFSAIEILNRVFYSKKLVTIPMAASLSGIAANLVLSRLFILNFNFPPVYITLAVLICQSAAAFILIAALKIKIGEIFDRDFLVNIIKIVLNSAVLLIIIKILYYIMGNSAFDSSLLKNISVGLIILISGTAVYALSNIIFKTNESKAFFKMLKK